MTSPAQRCFEAAFSVPRDPRSDAYKAGVLGCLRFNLDGIRPLKDPYAPGTAESDAWHAGTNEGHAIARKRRADHLGSTSAANA